eukprot:10583199-Alexandrium_andersonii.AAC.1
MPPGAEERGEECLNPVCTAKALGPVLCLVSVPVSEASAWRACPGGPAQSADAWPRRPGVFQAALGKHVLTQPVAYLVRQ